MDKAKLFAPNPRATRGGALWSALQDQQPSKPAGQNPGVEGSSREARLRRRAEERRQKQQSHAHSTGGPGLGAASLLNDENKIQQPVALSTNAPQGVSNSRDRAYEAKRQRFLQSRNQAERGGGALGQSQGNEEVLHPGLPVRKNKGPVLNAGTGMLGSIKANTEGKGRDMLDVIERNGRMTMEARHLDMDQRQHRRRDDNIETSRNNGIRVSNLKHEGVSINGIENAIADAQFADRRAAQKGHLAQMEQNERILMEARHLDADRRKSEQKYSAQVDLQMQSKLRQIAKDKVAEQLGITHTQQHGLQHPQRDHTPHGPLLNEARDRRGQAPHDTPNHPMRSGLNEPARARPAHGHSPQRGLQESPRGHLPPNKENWPGLYEQPRTQPNFQPPRDPLGNAQDPKEKQRAYAQALEQQIREKKGGEPGGKPAISLNLDGIPAFPTSSREDPAAQEQARKQSYARDLEQQMRERREKDGLERNRWQAPNMAPSIPHVDPNQERLLKQKQYAQELEQQMREQQARKRSNLDKPIPAANHNMPAMNAEHDQRIMNQRQYAQELEQQIREKRGHNSPNRSRRRNEFAGQIPLNNNHKNEQIPAQYVPHQNTEEEARLAKQREYAKELQQQMQEQKGRNGRNRNRRRPPVQDPNMFQSPQVPTINPEQFQRVKEQQEYAQALQAQIAARQMRDNPRQNQHTNYPPQIQYMSAPQPYVEKSKTQQQLEYAQALQQQIAEKNANKRRSNRPQPHIQSGYNARVNSQMNNQILNQQYMQMQANPGNYLEQHQPQTMPEPYARPHMSRYQLQASPGQRPQNNGMDEKYEKRMKQLAYKRELEMQQAQKQQQIAAEKAQERYDDAQLRLLQQQNAPPPSSQISPSRRRAYHRPGYPSPAPVSQPIYPPHGDPMGQYMSPGPGTIQTLPPQNNQGYNQMPPHLASPSQQRLYPDGGMPSLPSNGMHSPNRIFTRFKADASDPSVQAELAEKRMKQLQRKQELTTQIELAQKRKQEEKERAKAEEAEEEARLAREREEIQKAFEKEKAEQKRAEQQKHQEELKKQIEAKKKQKEAELLKQKKEEEAENARIERDRQQLERRFMDGRVSARSDASGGGMNSARSNHSDTQKLKENLFEPLSSSASTSGRKQTGTAHLFDSPVPSPRGSTPKQTPGPASPYVSPVGNRRRHTRARKAAWGEETEDRNKSRLDSGTQDVMERLLMETEAARLEQKKTREELQNVQMKLERIGSMKNEVSYMNTSSSTTNNYDLFSRDVLGYGYNPKSSQESPFQRTAHNVIGSPGKWARESLKSPTHRKPFADIRLSKLNTIHAKSPRSSSDLPTSPSIDLMKSLYPNLSNQSSSQQKNSMQQSLRSESRFIFPNGESLSATKLRPGKGAKPPLICEQASIDYGRDDGGDGESKKTRKQLQTHIEDVNESNSKTKFIERQSSTVDCKNEESILTQIRKEETDESNIKTKFIKQTTEKVIEDTVQETKSLGKRCTKSTDLLLSPNFDIYRIHQHNRQRLVHLDKFGDCSKLQGDQLDAFLDEFLENSCEGDEIKSIEDMSLEKSLDCETRWILKKN